MEVQGSAPAGLSMVPRAVGIEARPPAELGRTLLALAHEQTRHHLELLRALTEAVDWDNRTRKMDWEQILQHQGEILQRSQARTAQLHRRSLELSRAVLQVMADSRRSGHAA